MPSRLNKMQIITRNFASLSFSQFISLGLGVFISIFTIRYLGVTNYGRYSLVITIVGLFGFVVDLGLSQLVIREVSKKREDADKYFGNFLIVQTAIGIGMYLLLVIFVNVLHYPQVIRLGAYIVGGSMLLNALARPFYAILTALEEMQIVALANTIGILLNFVGLLAVIHFKANLNAFFTLILASSLVSTLFFILFSRRFFRITVQFDRILIKHLLLLTIPFALLMTFNIIYGKVDVFLISRILHSDSAVGLYSSAYKFIDALIILMSTISGVLFPVIVKNFADAGATNFIASRAIKYTSAVGLPIAFGVSLLGTKIITTVLGQNFHDSGNILKILIWIIALVSAYSILGCVLTAANKVSMMVRFNALGIVVNVAANLFFIPRLGIKGAAISNIISEVMMLALYAYYSRNYLQYRQLRYDFLKIAGGCGLMFVAWKFLPSMNLLLMIIILALVYGATLLLTKFIHKNEYHFIKQIWAAQPK